MEVVLAVNIATVAFHLLLWGYPATLTFLTDSGVTRLVLMPLWYLDLKKIERKHVIGWEEAWKLKYSGLKGLLNKLFRFLLFGCNPEVVEAWLRATYPSDGYIVTDERPGAFVVEMRREVNPSVEFYIYAKGVCFDTHHSTSVQGWESALPMIRLRMIHFHPTLRDVLRIRAGVSPEAEQVIHTVCTVVPKRTLQSIPVVLEINPVFALLFGIRPFVGYIRQQMPWLD